MKELRLKDEDTYLLVADFKEKEVRTNCGDFYYDYSISFDDFIKFAHFIENEMERYKHEDKTTA